MSTRNVREWLAETLQALAVKVQPPARELPVSGLCADCVQGRTHVQPTGEDEFGLTEDDYLGLMQ